MDSEESVLLSETLAKVQEELRREYRGCDGGITVTAKRKGAGVEPALHPTSLQKVIFFLMNIPNGVEKMSGEIPGLVETSSNLGILRLGGGELTAAVSVRSSVESAKTALGDRICYLTEFLGGEFQTEGIYPAWEFREQSALRDKMAAVYREMYGSDPKVEVIHAGLECGLFMTGSPTWTACRSDPISSTSTQQKNGFLSPPQRVYTDIF